MIDAKSANMQQQKGGKKIRYKKKIKVLQDEIFEVGKAAI